MTDDDQETLPGHQHLRQSLPGPPGRPAGKVLIWRRDTDSTARQRAESGDGQAATLLEQGGLSTVSI
jgi:hypothetical protein